MPSLKKTAAPSRHRFMVRGKLRRLPARNVCEPVLWKMCSVEFICDVCMGETSGVSQTAKFRVGTSDTEKGVGNF